MSLPLAYHGYRDFKLLLKKVMIKPSLYQSQVNLTQYGAFDKYHNIRKASVSELCEF